MEFGSALNTMQGDLRFLAGGGQSTLVAPRIVASSRAADARDSVTRTFFPHRLHTHSRDSLVNFSHCSANLGAISINHISYGAPLDIVIDELQRSHFVLAICLTGSAIASSDGQRKGMVKGDCVLMSPSMRYKFELAPDHSQLTIGIPAVKLAGAGRPIETVHNVVERNPANAKGGGADLLTFIEYICGELHRGSPLFALPSVVEGVEASLLAMLRASLFDGGDGARQSSILPGYVLRAERFIAGNLVEDIGLDDIVAAAGVPARTLYHGFEQFLGHSPMRWLKMQRLERARADLIGSNGALSVTELASRYWMGHCGRFARMYREQYGETPSATLNRLRCSEPIPVLSGIWQDRSRLC